MFLVFQIMSLLLEKDEYKNIFKNSFLCEVTYPTEFVSQGFASIGSLQYSYDDLTSAYTNASCCESNCTIAMKTCSFCNPLLSDYFHENILLESYSESSFEPIMQFMYPHSMTVFRNKTIGMSSTDIFVRPDSHDTLRIVTQLVTSQYLMIRTVYSNVPLSCDSRATIKTSTYILFSSEEEAHVFESMDPFQFVSDTLLKMNLHTFINCI